MAFAGQAAWWVYYDFPSVCVVAFVDEFAGFALIAEAEGFVGYQFICAEAVMEFDYAHFWRFDPSFFVYFLSAFLSHRVSNNFPTIIPNLGKISRQLHRQYLNSLILLS